MRLSVILADEAHRSDGLFSIMPVPDEIQPSVETLNRIEREITAQISANEAMSSRSMHYASRSSFR